MAYVGSVSSGQASPLLIPTHSDGPAARRVCWAQKRRAAGVSCLRVKSCVARPKDMSTGVRGFSDRDRGAADSDGRPFPTNSQIVDKTNQKIDSVELITLLGLHDQRLSVS